MNKEYFENLAKYNIWANSKVFSWLNQISDSQWNTKLVGSMESIAATCIHTAGAEKIWLDRLDGLNTPFLTTTFNGGKAELIEIWNIASVNLNTYISNLPENEFETEFDYKNMAGQKFTSKRFEAFAHVFNHSTYHRGQIVNYLRQVGFTDVGSTDLIAFFRL